MDEKKSTILTIRIDESLHNALKQLAERERRTVAGQIRVILEDATASLRVAL